MDSSDALPIYELRESLARSMAPRPGGVRLVIEAPTGSGKSTQIPRMLVNDRLIDGQVVVLQPRRIAARVLARWVARQQGTRLGDAVGFQVRFENVASAQTRIRYVTEGIILREMLANPALPHVGAIIFDEFHERHLYGDITLARAVDVQQSLRPEIALIVMSATLEAERLREFLAPCEFLRSEGRMFPVEIRHAPPRGLTEPVWEHASRVSAEAARTTAGDLLIFMPGAYEIRRTIEAIRHSKWAREFEILPLHGELPPADQDRAVDPGSRRKIVVSTNVAETSLTIEGVTAVIDSGLARIPRFDAQRGINTLTVGKIAQSSAQQRAGRAGRTRAGICWRMWSESDHARRPAQELPEVRRLDLAEVILFLLAGGVENLDRFRWIEKPEEAAIDQAVELLRELGAATIECGTGDPPVSPSVGGTGGSPVSLSVGGTGGSPVSLSGGPPLAHPPATHVADPSAGRRCHQARSAPTAARSVRITPLGRRLITYPLHPRHARILEAARSAGVLPVFALLLALLQGRPLFGRQGAEIPGHFVDGDEFSDLQPLLRAFDAARAAGFDRHECARLGVNDLAAREAGQLAAQLARLARASDDHADRARPMAAETFATILLAGFSDQVARRTSEGSLACVLTGGRRGRIQKESLIRRSPLVLAAEVREIESRDVQVILSGLTAIDEGWLERAFPRDFERRIELVWDEAQRRVMRLERVTFRDLVLSERQSGEPDRDRAAAILAERASTGELRLNGWDDAADQWIARLNCLARWMPELDLPALGPADRRFVIEQMCHGATSYKEIKDRSPWPTLRSWLGAQQSTWLDEHAPERLRLPDGRTAKIIYAENADPVVSARIQQIFGMETTPRIAGGRVPVVVSIMGPNMRPLQVTQDLAGFWQNHYPRLKQELQRKYPKHEWR